MGVTIISMVRLLASISALVLLWTHPALGQSGKLLEESLVILHDAQLHSFAKRNPSMLNMLANVEVKRLAYLSDGLKVQGYLATPKQGDRLPCVIFNRGGNRELGALSDAHAAMLLGEMASWGYMVVASQYRGNAGGDGREEFGGADVNDVLNLVPLLESLPQADTARIGMYGWSRGGMMTYIALTKTDRMAAAIVGAGMANLFDTIERRPEMERQVYAELVPEYAHTKVTALMARSAVQWPEKLHKQTPILLLHGSADWRVHPTQALQMATKLYESRHPFRFVLFEGGDHGLTAHRTEDATLAFPGYAAAPLCRQTQARHFGVAHPIPLPGRACPAPLATASPHPARSGGRWV